MKKKCFYVEKAWWVFLISGKNNGFCKLVWLWTIFKFNLLFNYLLILLTCFLNTSLELYPLLRCKNYTDSLPIKNVRIQARDLKACVTSQPDALTWDWLIDTGLKFFSLICRPDKKFCTATVRCCCCSCLCGHFDAPIKLLLYCNPLTDILNA